MTFSSVELFAGGGGLALGVEQAGLSHVGLVEHDPMCCVTLRHNRPSWNVLATDISSIKDPLKVFSLQEAELDLLTGGPPCQSFSHAGKRRGLDDARGTLFYEFGRILSTLKPKFFLFENVRGLTTHDGGRTKTVISNALASCGYNVVFEQVVNAFDYGVPQKRERFFMVGSRQDLPVAFEPPSLQVPRPVVRDALQDVPVSAGASYPDNKRKLFDLVPMGGNWRDLPVEIAQDHMKKLYWAGGGRVGVLKRLHLDEPSPTILCGPQQNLTERCHPTESRPLTVRECARIQGFPDDWIFAGSTSTQYKQIGNAVPPPLARAFATQIVKSLAFRR